MLFEYSQDKIKEQAQESLSTPMTSDNLMRLMCEWVNLDLDLIRPVLKEILKDPTITEHQYKCVGMVAPESEKLNVSHLSNYHLSYDFSAVSDDLFDTYVEMDLVELLESNLNSKFVENIIK